jgi:signal peptidase I
MSMNAGAAMNPTNGGAAPAGPEIAKSASRAQGAGKLLLGVILAVATYYFTTHYVIQTVRVVGRSMHPTLHDSDYYLLNRFVYLARQPRPSDIIVLKDPDQTGYSVKRVIASPGDEVRLAEGKVLVNGKEIPEPYLEKGTPTYPSGSAGQEVFRCPKDAFFVLGDNRMNSADSRVYGPVPRANILGVIIR